MTSAITLPVSEKPTGPRDYCLILGITVPGNLPDEPPSMMQWPVLEIWNSNDQMFPNFEEALKYAIACLGKKVGQVLNEPYTWDVAGPEYENARITGIDIQPAVRDEDGHAQEWEWWAPLTVTCKELWKTAMVFSLRKD